MYNSVGHVSEYALFYQIIWIEICEVCISNAEADEIP